MKILDPGTAETEAILIDVEREVHEVYARAATETQAKLDAYLAGFAARDEAKRELVDLGKLSESDYLAWRQDQIIEGERWQSMVNVLAEDHVNADQIAMSIVSGHTPDAYAVNMNYGTYQVENMGQINTGFTLYDRQTVERLIRDKPELLPRPEVDIPADLRWNQQHIRNEITQAVLQGEAIPKVASRLQSVTDMDRRAAIRNARTAMTGAQNAGRLDAYRRAESMGIEMRKEWVASGDGLTRESHADVDGEQVEVGANFSNGLEYPGDPGGPPEEVYNCRCTIKPALKSLDQFKGEKDPDVGSQDFEEWEEGKDTYEDFSENKVIDYGKFSYAVETEGVSRDDVWREWQRLCPALTDDERYIQDVYVQTARSFEINSAFRAAGENLENLTVSEILGRYGSMPRWAERVEGFDRLIAEHSLEKDTILTRLVSNRYAESVLGIEQGQLGVVIANFETEAVQNALGAVVGTQVTEFGFMSTAGAIDDRFQAFGSRNIVLRLYTPQGTPALYANPDELEVVLGRGTKYTIMGFGKETFVDSWGDSIDRLIVNCLVGG